jgi:HSP20 family protein
MAIQRWDPLRDLVRLRDTMNHMFSEALARSAAVDPAHADSAAWTPPLDLLEEADRYVLRADVPGVGQDDLELKIEDGRLTLRGQRRADAGAGREAYLRVERPQGPFSLQLALPASVEPRAIEARSANGVLEVVLPKRAAQSTATIPVARLNP